MLSRRPFAAALTLALVAPVTALSTSTASATPATSPASVSLPKAKPGPTTKHQSRPKRQPGTQQAHDPHTVLVKFKKNTSKTARDKATHSRGGRTAEAVDGTGFVKVTTTGKADELASRLASDPAVAEVTLDYIRKATATPNDPAYVYGDQSYLDTVHMPAAWDRSKGSLAQVVAVVDTGVDGQHPDLTGRTMSGMNFVPTTPVGIPTGAESDDNGHGSMVSGIIAAQTDNAVGIAGVAWNAKVMPVKVLDSTGQGSDTNVIKGIKWAVDHGAKTLNLSLGGPDDSPALHDAVKYAVGKGALVVVAAGNSGSDEPEYPAAYPEALAVAATDSQGALTDFSTHGDWVDVAAPGWGILSTRLKDYYFGDGTSFAAPIVSGIAVLIRTQNPTYTPAQISARLRATANDAGPRGIDPFYGYGVVDAGTALRGGNGGELPQPASGANEPNDVPSRATVLTDTIQGTIGLEGDVDWYRYDSPTQRTTQVTVTPPAMDPNLPQNVDAVLAVYDQNLRLVAQVDQGAEGDPESASLRLGGGTYYVSVRNFNGSRVGADRPYTLTVQPGSAGVLNAGTQVASSGGYGPLELADVDGDGRKDLVAGVASGAEAGNFHVRRGIAGGGFGSPVAYTTTDSSLVRSIAVTDLDGDGLLDVVVGTDAGIQVFPQTAAHTLGSPQVVPGTTGTTLVKAVDLDGDSHVDLVQATATDVAALMAQSDGTWVRTVIDTAPAIELEVGDLDGDERPDVATNHGRELHVLHNAADGWTTEVQTLLTDFDASGIEVADVNGDSLADLSAVTGGNSPSARLLVWHQKVDHTLAAPVVSGMPDIPGPLEAADLTGDGRLDLVSAHDSWSTASVMEQRPDGTLMPPSTSPMVSSLHHDPSGLVLGDVTGDGRVDAVVGTVNGFEILSNAGGPTVAGEQEWVRSAAPADFGSSAVATSPTVTFVRDVVPTSVSASTVGILNGRTGARLAATVSYNQSTRVATVKPTNALYDNAAYRILVSGVQDTSGATMTTPFTSTFRTVDTAPAAPGAFKAAGAWGSATLSWTPPAAYDLDTYIVKMAAGSVPPATVNSGTQVYWGTGTSVTVPKLANGTTYNFRIWARDRMQHYSAPATVTLVGTTTTIASSTTALTYGGSVSLSSKVTRRDTGTPIAGVPVQLLARKVGTSNWILVATRTSSSTGIVSVAHKPTASVDYLWVYRGSSTFMGSPSPARRVGVRMAITSNPSRTSVPLGGTFSMSGSVSPSHARQTVYIQRYVGSGKWTTLSSKPLSSTSTYSFSVKPTFRASSTYRVFLWDDGDHLASYGPSRVVKTT
ncbi:S8 family serine peptidase [Terrabacter sp. 2RAF25]|uniref:S8 family serine peptidase n=1 Tax=Terrabacter sp. 2RAF25 TaxID=3232998 RepID=UPI003F9834E9